MGAVGCSGAREYAVPDKICGVSSDPGFFAPLLPSGEEFKQQKSDLGAGSWRCRVFVDNSLALYVRGDVVSEDTDPIRVSDRSLRRMGHPEKADIGDDARIADQGALAVAACPGGKQAGESGKAEEKRKFALEIALQHETPEDTSERRQALSRFLDAYLPRALTAQDCGV